jgi:hypothetical protein
MNSITSKLKTIFANAKRDSLRIDPVQVAESLACSITQARKVASQIGYRMSDYGKAETETAVYWVRGRLSAYLPASSLRAAGLDAYERLHVKAVRGRIEITALNAQKPSANASERIGSSHNAI